MKSRILELCACICLCTVFEQVFKYCPNHDHRLLTRRKGYNNKRFTVSTLTFRNIIRTRPIAGTVKSRGRATRTTDWRFLRCCFEILSLAPILHKCTVIDWTPEQRQHGQSPLEKEKKNAVDPEPIRSQTRGSQVAELEWVPHVPKALSACAIPFYSPFLKLRLNKNTAKMEENGALREDNRDDARWAKQRAAQLRSTTNPLSQQSFLDRYCDCIWWRHERELFVYSYIIKNKG